MKNLLDDTIPLQNKVNRFSFSKLGSFATGIAYDTLLTKTYGIDSAPLAEHSNSKFGSESKISRTLSWLSNSYDEAHSSMPRFTKYFRLATEYAFWVSCATMGGKLATFASNNIVDSPMVTGLAYTLALSHPSLVSYAVNKSMGTWSGLKPDAQTYVTAYSISDSISTPLGIYFMGKILSNLSESNVSSSSALIAATACAATFGIVDYFTLRYLWKNQVLPESFSNLNSKSLWERFYDEWKGFKEEFRPFRFSLFKFFHKKVESISEEPKTLNRYLGQFLGTTLSSLVWPLAAFVATAGVVSVTDTNLDAKSFIPAFYVFSAKCGRMFFNGFMLGVSKSHVAKTLRKGNSSLGLIDEEGIQEET